MEKKMETTIEYWGYYWDRGKEKWKLPWYIVVNTGMMEKRMETEKTIIGGLAFLRCP